MGLRRYVFFAVVLVVLLGIYNVYVFQDKVYALNFFGTEITLPIALWVLVPAVILGFFSALHLMFYGFKNYVYNRSLLKDEDTFIQASKAALLGKSYEASFKTRWLSLPYQVLNVLSQKNPQIDKLENKDLKAICEDIALIKDKEYVNLKPYALSKDNPLFIQNTLNRLEKDPKSAAEVLKTCKESEKLQKVAFDILLKHATYTEIKKQNIALSPSQIIDILKRNADEEDSFVIEDSEVDALINTEGFDAKDYIQIVKAVKNKLNPQSLVAMFEGLSAKYTEATKAYLYVLFELQMIDKVREILLNMDEEDGKNFEAYLFLRDNGKNIDIDRFI